MPQTINEGAYSELKEDFFVLVNTDPAHLTKEDYEELKERLTNKDISQSGDLIRKRLISQKDEKGRTALYNACRLNNLRLAEMLLDAGADPFLKHEGNDSVDEGATPYLIAQEASPEIMKLIIIKGFFAMTNEAPTSFNDERYKKIALKLRETSEEIRQQLLCNTDEKGRTALYNACRLNNKDLAEILLKAGADPLLEVGLASSPYYVAKRRSPEIVRLFKENATEPQKEYYKLLDEREEDHIRNIRERRKNPEVSASHDDLAVGKVSSGAMPQSNVLVSQDDSGVTKTFVPVAPIVPKKSIDEYSGVRLRRKKLKEVAEFLGVKDVGENEAEFCNKLITCMCMGKDGQGLEDRKTKLNEFYSKNKGYDGVDVAFLDKREVSLEEMVRQEDSLISFLMKDILASGATPEIPRKLSDGSQGTYISIACTTGNFRVAGALFDHLQGELGESIKSHVNMPGANKRTPLHECARSGNEEAKHFADRLLAVEGVTVDSRDEDGNTPFLCACISGDLAMVQKLIDAGSDVTATNKESQNGLHVLSICSTDLKEDRLKVAKLLMDNGVAVDGLDKGKKRADEYIFDGVNGGSVDLRAQLIKGVEAINKSRAAHIDLLVNSMNLDDVINEYKGVAPDDEKLQLICDFLGIKKEELLFEEDPQRAMDYLLLYLASSGLDMGDLIKREGKDVASLPAADLEKEKLKIMYAKDLLAGGANSLHSALEPIPYSSLGAACTYINFAVANVIFDDACSKKEESAVAAACNFMNGGEAMNILHYCASHNNNMSNPLVEKLLKIPGVEIDKADGMGHTALASAIMFENEPNTRLLMQKKAKPSLAVDGGEKVENSASPRMKEVVAEERKIIMDAVALRLASLRVTEASALDIRVDKTQGGGKV